MSNNSQKPLHVAVVGCGHRSVLYASYALEHPERMRVVAVADPNVSKRNHLADTHGVPDEMRLDSYERLADRPGLADAVINGTMDKLHHASGMALLKAGYPMLLEKPIAPTPEELFDLAEEAKRRKLPLMICHVLRYAPFYATIKQLIRDGRIGQILSLDTTECVSYHHVAVAYIRGKWNRREVNPILMAKCCHDLDIIAWLLSDTQPQRVASMGSRMFFRPENAPDGAGHRCLVDCAIEPHCPYSARLHYLTKGYWGEYVWDGLGQHGESTEQHKMEFLKTTSPHGRCVWACDNDVVDHQNVMIEFANGATASHQLYCGTARATRKIHIVGTRGEIEGDFEAGRLTLRELTCEKKPDCREEIIDLNIAGGGGAGGHGGGDLKLVDDFVSVLRGESNSVGATRIEDSLAGHVMAFAADRSMQCGRIISLPEAFPIFLSARQCHA